MRQQSGPTVPVGHEPHKNLHSQATSGRDGRTTLLLVSVRSAAEAEIALAGGADLIDVKEPLRGPLGAADPQVWDEVNRAIDGRVTTSVALGELRDGVEGVGSFFRPTGSGDGSSSGRKRLPTPFGFTYAKLGLAGCRSIHNWQDHWRQAIATFPAGVSPVAVAYADHASADSPPLHEVLELARPLGCRAFLVDTFDKSRGGLLDYLSLVEVETLIETCKGQSLLCVLAGSLNAVAIEQLLPLAPDYLGVRGAACAGRREESLDASRVKSLAHLVHLGPREMIGAGA